MSQHHLSATVSTTIQDLTLTPSGRYVRVHFSPACLPWHSDDPVEPLTRISLERCIRSNIRIGDAVELTLDGATGRHMVRRVFLQVLEAANV